MGRATGCHYCPTWVTGVWLALGILALLLTAACRRGFPAVDPGTRAPAPPKHRVEAPARDGEPLLKRPVRAARPRGPAYRLDNGLGSPIT
jgi:hypothetical protein